MRLFAIAALVVLVLAAVVWLRRDSSEATGGVVARVLDGDTVVLASGGHVRLVQIDAPEKASECYGQEAGELTSRLLPPGTHVRIEPDPDLDQVDRFGRRLAYVWKGDEDVNVTLVRAGAAGVWFFHRRRGRHADELLQAAEEARAERRGLWGACPLARFDPVQSLASGPS